MTTDVATALPEDALLSYVSAQRWFGAKSRDAVGVRIVDHAHLRREPPMFVDALAEVRFAAGTHEVYQLLIGLRDSESAPDEPVIAEVDGLTAYGAFADPAAAREVIHLVRGGATMPTQDG